MEVTWKEYKDIVSQHIETQGSYIYRGQSDASWTLVSSLMRSDLIWSREDFKSYFNFVLPQVKDKIQAWEGRDWNLADNLGLAEFVAYLQHNGFPTPLLDWTFSPYIGAYFAFEEVNHFDPQTDHVAIYSFNQDSWCKKYNQEYDFAHDTNHVSILRPRMVGNHKLSLQQGCFTFSNVRDIEQHIKIHEGHVKETYLHKYTLKVSERPRVISELALMGISAVQLMPCVESVCKKALNDLIGLHPVGRSKRV